MIRISAKGRRALGRAAETAPSPPTRTKSSISVVTNKTLKNDCPLPIPIAAMQDRVQLPLDVSSPHETHWFGKDFPTQPPPSRVGAPTREKNDSSWYTGTRQGHACS